MTTPNTIIPRTMLAGTSRTERHLFFSGPRKAVWKIFTKDASVSTEVTSATALSRGCTVKTDS